MPFVKVVKAIYDYSAEAEDELSFSEGDVLGVVEETGDDDWYSACLISSPDSVAMIPKTYVEECESQETMTAAYNYEAQEDSELTFIEGEQLEILHKIDEDWWIAKSAVGECGMVPSNYFEKASFEESEEPEEHAEPEDSQERVQYEPIEEQEEAELIESSEPGQPSKVDLLKESSDLKLQCDALFLDTSHAKCKGRLFVEEALFLTHENEIKRQFDFMEISKYNVDDSKLYLTDGSLFAIGLGKRDAKMLADLMAQLCPNHEQQQPEQEEEEDEKESIQQSPPPLPQRAPTVVAPKIPENYASNNSISATPQKTPMVVGVDFEGTEGQEISVIEGEEVYLLEASIAEDAQFSRIEKSNGLQGIVPKSFLITRSEYQKQREERKAAEEAKQREAQQREAEQKEAEKTAFAQSVPVMPSVTVEKQMASLSIKSPQTKPKEATESAVAIPSANQTANDPWSALAKTGKIAKPSTTSNNQPAVELKEGRIWKDKTGKFQVEAEFVSFADGQVTILKSNGSKVTVPLKVLSERDCEYVAHKTGMPVDGGKKEKSSNSSSTIVKGFDWLAFFMAFGLDTQKAQEYAYKFAGQGFEESMIASFTSDFLTTQGLAQADIYKILPEAARRKAALMQSDARNRHRANNTQMVVSSGSPKVPSKSAMVAKTSASPAPKFSALEMQVAPLESAVENEIQKFPTIEELEAVEGSIKMAPGNSQVALPGGIQVSKTTNDPNHQVVIQPVSADSNVKERHRQVVGADGSVANEFVKMSTTTSTTNAFLPTPATSALMQMQAAQQAQVAQQQMAMQMAQAQAAAQVQAQMQMQARMQAQAQAQMQMQMAAQQQAAAAAMAQQQQAANQPTVHITIQTGGAEKPTSMPGMSGMQMNPMNPMNPMMNQMNPMNQMVPAINPMNPLAPAAINPMNPMSGMMPNNMNPFFPNGGFGF